MARKIDPDSTPDVTPTEKAKRSYAVSTARKAAHQSLTDFLLAKGEDTETAAGRALAVSMRNLLAALEG